MWNTLADSSERGAKYHSRLASKLVERIGFRFGLPPLPVLLVSSRLIEPPSALKSGRAIVRATAKRATMSRESS